MQVKVAESPSPLPLLMESRPSCQPAPDGDREGAPRGPQHSGIIRKVVG